ncbi:MAG: sigma-54 dependent transcriptional regulator [Bacteroidales bacterium]|nr:sigma-54 dependent transcriptional regulator [Bacteroidales bacterium]
MHKILIIDDDVFICNVLEKYLKDNTFEVKSAYSASSAKKVLKEEDFDVVLCDYRLPDSDGIRMLDTIRRLNPGARVVIITAYADVNIAVKLIKSGADDYVVKPIQQEEILHLVRELLSNPEKQQSRVVQSNGDFFFGNSQEIARVLELARVVAPTDMSVIIDGETGSGKEFLARFIHANSHRSSKPFVALDCGAIPKTLANSELFGHIKGSFTGAVADKIGVFQEADGGTLFLDEIGNLEYEVQVKLLRTLQERMVTRVGDPKATRIDVRIIAASNEDLKGQVRENNFREDLYHRLNEFMIHLPPLRERQDDIIAYAEFFMKEANTQLDRNITDIDQEARSLLMNYSWGGNLRELRNVIKRAVLMTASGAITKEAFPEEIRSFYLHQSLNTGIRNASSDLRETSLEAEKELIIETLKSVDNNKSKAARLLKIDRKTLYNKMKRLEISLQSSSASDDEGD